MIDHVRTTSDAAPDAAVPSKRASAGGRRGPVGSGDLDTRFPRTLQSALRAAGAALAPPTAVVALAVYFAVRRQEALALHFGIDTSVLDFTVQDYLLRAGDPLFVAALFLLGTGLLGLWGHQALLRRLERPGTAGAARLGAAVAAAVGGVVVVVGVAAVFVPLPGSPPVLVRTLSLGVGVGLLAYARWLRHRTRDDPDPTPFWLATTSLVLVAALMALSAFWTTKELAEALGRGQAAVLETSLSSRPGVVLYSRDDLHLSGPGVGREVLPDGVHRYEGLRLLVRTGGRYLLLPDGWTRDSGTALVVPESAALRFEFTPPGR